MNISTIGTPTVVKLTPLTPNEMANTFILMSYSLKRIRKSENEENRHFLSILKKVATLAKP